ncbi:MAG: phosphate ABC transporter permease subunit PstC [Chloroflexota bacterium]
MLDSVQQISAQVKKSINWVRFKFQHGDLLWKAVTILMASGLLVLMLSIGWLLWSRTTLAQETYGWSFIIPSTETSWNPVTERFQAWAFLYGTVVTSLFAILIALPVSLGVAIFLTELCPYWLRQPISWLVELLAAIPSVVYGLWGIFVFLPTVVTPLGQLLDSLVGHLPLLNGLFGGPIPESGASRLAAALVLAIMIIPTITAVTREVFLAIPNHQREAALALGATRFELVWHILIPYGLSGILGAIILGLGRALGETMAVTMVIGNSTQNTTSLLKPGYTLASIIANEFAEATSELHLQALELIGLLLFAITLLLNALARLLVWQAAKRNSIGDNRL